jgi:hypothetical protein
MVESYAAVRRPAALEKATCFVHILGSDGEEAPPVRA